MKLTSLAGALTVRLVCIVAIAMAAGGAIIPATVAAEESSGPVGIGIVPTEESDDDQGEPREPDPTGTTEPDPPPTEPVPTEPHDEQLPPDDTSTEEPDSGEGDGREDDAVAPGFVTLVIFTSDGGPTGDGTFACVGNVCQPAAGLASGTKVLFPDIDAGWNDVTVETGYRGGNASTSVQVTAGQGSWVELTLVTPVGVVRDEPEPTPVSRTGPLRSAPAIADSEEQPPWSTNTLVVSSMPVTGSANQGGATVSPLVAASMLLSAAAACALAARWTARSRGN